MFKFTLCCVVFKLIHSSIVSHLIGNFVIILEINFQFLLTFFNELFFECLDCLECLMSHIIFGEEIDLRVPFQTDLSGATTFDFRLLSYTKTRAVLLTYNEIQAIRVARLFANNFDGHTISKAVKSISYTLQSTLFSRGWGTVQIQYDVGG